MLKEIATHVGEGDEGENAMTQICCYLGNVHVQPIARLWNTYSSDGVYSSAEALGKEETTPRKSVLLSKQREQRRKGVKSDFVLDYVKLSQMRYDNDTPAEEKIAKQALMEALFETQLWMEPYVKNPFIYITDNDSDFEGPRGQKLENYFKQVFLSQYNKYRKVISENMPPEHYLERKQFADAFTEEVTR